MMDPFTVFNDPERHAVLIPALKLVADDKVFRDGVERYKKILGEGGDIGAIIVVKHPVRDVYAVLDGHHRFWAQKELGVKFIRCAVIEDFFGLMFHMTKEGFFQPSPEFTKYVRVPVIKFGEELTRFLNEFLLDPFAMLLDEPEEKDAESDGELYENDLF